MGDGILCRAAEAAPIRNDAYERLRATGHYLKVKKSECFTISPNLKPLSHTHVKRTCGDKAGESGNIYFPWLSRIISAAGLLFHELLQTLMTEPSLRGLSEL